MKREIKFRAKRKDNNKWAFGDLVKDNAGGAWIETNLQTWRENCDDVDAFGSRLYVDIDTVGQFTGLTDKNGREIYEGDVLRINNGAVICLLVVTWNAEVGSWCLRFKEELKEGTRPLGRWLCDRDYDIELTGNIYDNKELLEE